MSTIIRLTTRPPSQRSLGQRDARVRCIRRVGRRGLAGAFIEGALSSQAQFVAVMDADLQHDESLLPQMLELLMRQSADLVIGSRYTVGGDASGFSATRRSISRIATQWARRLTRTAVKDPMSGFFMMRRDLVDQLAPALSNEGFKILFDILVTARGANLKIVELPYGFRARKSGESKFDVRNAVDFASLILAKLTGNTVPLRFLSFLLVGGSGVAVQLACLWQGLAAGLSFASAEADGDIGRHDQQLSAEQPADLSRSARCGLASDSRAPDLLCGVLDRRSQQRRRLLLALCAASRVVARRHCRLPRRGRLELCRVV